MAKRSPSKAPWGTTDDQPRESTTVPTYFKPGSYTGIMEDMATKMAFGTPHRATENGLVQVVEDFRHLGIQPFENVRIQERAPYTIEVLADISIENDRALRKKGTQPNDLLETVVGTWMPAGVKVLVSLFVAVPI